MKIKPIKPQKFERKTSSDRQQFLYDRKGAFDTRRKEDTFVAFINDEDFSSSSGSFPTSITPTGTAEFFGCEVVSTFKINFRLAEDSVIFAIASFRANDSSAALFLDGVEQITRFTTDLDIGSSCILVDYLSHGTHTLELKYGDFIESPRLTLYSQQIIVL